MASVHQIHILTLPLRNLTFCIYCKSASESMQNIKRNVYKHGISMV